MKTALRWGKTNCYGVVYVAEPVNCRFFGTDDT